jgi:4-hydroxy-tetrahydrodipicolinate synthase
MSNHLELLRQKIRGPVFSIITPFRERDDAIDFAALERYITYAYESGARNFYVMGYNSRFSELSWEEIKILNTFVTKTVKCLGKDTIVIVADPLHCSTAVSMEFCRHAEDIGADMISLIFREKHYSDEQVAKHYQMCANASDIGILIHEMPFISGHGGHTVNWPIALLDRLADIKNIIAIKEDAKDDEYSHQVISTIKDRLSIVISGGGKRQWLQFADLGCQAWLNGIGVFEPKLAIRFWEAYKQNDQSLMQKIINEIETPFFKKGVSVHGWHLMIRAALEIRGFFSRHERMPMLALTDAELASIKEWFQVLPIEKIID